MAKHFGRQFDRAVKPRFDMGVVRIAEVIGREEDAMRLWDAVVHSAIGFRRHQFCDAVYNRFKVGCKINVCE